MSVILSASEGPLTDTFDHTEFLCDRSCYC